MIRHPKALLAAFFIALAAPGAALALGIGIDLPRLSFPDPPPVAPPAAPVVTQACTIVNTTSTCPAH